MCWIFRWQSFRCKVSAAACCRWRPKWWRRPKTAHVSTKWDEVERYKWLGTIFKCRFFYFLRQTKTIELLVKAPVTNAVFASIFQPAESCIKENGFYLQVIPSLLQLQRERGLAENELIDVFIHCYGARLSHNPGTKFTCRAVWLCTMKCMQ